MLNRDSEGPTYLLVLIWDPICFKKLSADSSRRHKQCERWGGGAVFTSNTSSVSYEELIGRVTDLRSMDHCLEYHCWHCIVSLSKRLSIQKWARPGRHLYIGLYRENMKKSCLKLEGITLWTST